MVDTALAEAEVELATIIATNIKTLPGGGAEIVTVPVPAEPARGEVQIKNNATGICSWDLQTFRIGLSGPGGGAPPGHEGLGTIVKLGEGVRDLKVGDKVTGGGFASVKNLAAKSIYKIPEDTKLADHHWVVEPVSCVVTGIDHCHAKPGERIALVGCGFMSAPQARPNLIRRRTHQFRFLAPVCFLTDRLCC